MDRDRVKTACQVGGVCAASAFFAKGTVESNVR
jgi:hypothetical protein